MGAKKAPTPGQFCFKEALAYKRCFRSLRNVAMPCLGQRATWNMLQLGRNLGKCQSQGRANATRRLCGSHRGSIFSVASYDAQLMAGYSAINCEWFGSDFHPEYGVFRQCLPQSLQNAMREVIVGAYKTRFRCDRW